MTRAMFLERYKDLLRIQSHAAPHLVKEGDWVIFKLGELQRQNLHGVSRTTDTLKSQPRWSLPAKVVGVQDLQLTVHLLGDPVRDIKIPLRQTRVLPTDIPRCLADLVKKDIRYDAPKSRLLDYSAGGTITRDTLMKEANEMAAQDSDGNFMP